MAVRDVFSAHLYLGPSSYQDITSGIINVDIQFGTDVYEGPQQQIDTAQFTLVTRNPAMDPKINANVGEGSVIEFRDSRNVEAGKTNVFFVGYVTNIDVQYQRQDDAIITITGTDIFGLLQRTIITPEIEQACKDWAGGIVDEPDENGPSLSWLSTSTDWDLTSPATINVIDIATNPSTPGGIDPSSPYDNYLGYNPARYLPKVGETFLEVLNKYTQTNLQYCSINFRQTPGVIDVYPFAKYNPLFWTRIQDPTLEFPIYNFSSDPADGRPYETILINNGYDRKTKSIAMSNETRVLEDYLDPFSPIVSNSATYGPYNVDQYQSQIATNLSTNFAQEFIDTGALELYATDIFQVVNFSFDEIQQITFDNGRFEDIQDDYTYSFSQLNQFVRIKHQINQNQLIDRFYDIAGISHNISPDKWEMGFTFKPSQNEIAFNYQVSPPTIQMNSLTGDSNFNFTATITDFPTEQIDEVIWCLNGTNSDIIEQWAYTASGARYKDGLQRNGLTQTWNFDDDGILDGPVIPTGGYGTGEWHVIPYIILKNGWIVTTSVKLTVGTPEVEARFSWTQNLTDNFAQVLFVDDSRNNEIGETDSYLWTFGDGTTSTERNPVKQYDPAPATTQYNVSLRVFTYGPGQIKIFNTKTTTITLQRPTMSPNFTWVANFSEVTFTNTSTNVGLEEPDAYLWEFGDGTTSTLKNPVKNFPVTDANVPTNFVVKLTTRNVWEQTANIQKTVSVLAQNTTGNYPVRYIKLSTEVIKRTGTGLEFYALTPVFSDFRARTSNTNASLIENAPLIGFGNFYAPQMTYHSADVSGSAPKEIYNLSKYLTRSEYDILPYTTNEMVGVGVGVTQGSSPIFVRHELVVEVPESAWYSIAKLESFVRNIRINGVSQEETFNPKISVDVATTVTNYTPNDPGVYGPPKLNGDWVNIGYFKFTTGYIFQTAQMTRLRPMPMNIPYFLYTFGQTTETAKTGTFTSVETAPVGGSYLWTFGDGTTSTEKNPVKTFANFGTFNVNLTIKTSGGTTVRSTTEPVIVQAAVI
jgi:PKD repeat protein